MTISYTREVATCTGLGVFWKLLFRWKGSIYKLVWQNLLLYLILYYILSFTYRFVLGDKGRENFENISVYCKRFAELIPVTFVLGFYVSIVITRWWGQYKIIPWPDSCCLFISTCIQGHDDRGRLMRRTIARYLIVALIQTLRMTCVQVKKRFPTLGHMSEAGIITENERKIIEGLDEKCIQHPKYWMSLVWAGAVVTRAKKEGRITDQFAFQTIITEINKFRSGCGGLLDYDWISVPLVYTQVVTLAVYTFFLSSLMGCQFLDPAKKLEGHEVDLMIPVFTFLQFFFYMGWLKVAEALINPFGEDDDDFEMNWLIDRNLQVAYLIVDEMHAEHPELVKDQFWDEGIPDELPYTVAAEEFRTEPWLGSTAEVHVSEQQGEFINMDKIDEEDLEPGSDDELNQVTIEDVKPTQPVNIMKNGVLKSTIMTIGSDCESSLQESMMTLPTGQDKATKASSSILSVLHKIFPSNPVSRSHSRAALSRINSDQSMASKVYRPRRRRRRVMQHDKSAVSPGMSRINTTEHDIFKMSETSSQNSDSEFPTRSNSEAQALREVRDRLKMDLQRYQGNQENQPVELRPGTEPSGQPQGVQEKGGRGVQAPRQRKHSLKGMNERAESLAHTVLMKKKLQELQVMQAQIMQELDEEMKLHCEEDQPPDTTDLITQLAVKTLELSNALQYKKVAAHRLSGCGGESEMSLVRRRHDSAQEERVASPQEQKPGRGSLSLHIGSPSYSHSSPSSPVQRQTSSGQNVDCLHSPGYATGLLHAMKPISAMSTNSTLSLHSTSNISLGDTLFEMDFRKEQKDGDEEEDSEPSSIAATIMANPNLEDDADDSSALWQPEGNLGTIPELPELGYQSDSSDTELLLPRSREKPSSEKVGGGEQALPSVPEETSA